MDKGLVPPPGLHPSILPDQCPGQLKLSVQSLSPSSSPEDGWQKVVLCSSHNFLKIPIGVGKMYAASMRPAPNCQSRRSDARKSIEGKYRFISHHLLSKLHRQLSFQRFHLGPPQKVPFSRIVLRNLNNFQMSDWCFCNDIYFFG